MAQLGRDPALQATTLFALLGTLQPGRYRATQLRSLQRRIAGWRAQHGPAQEVIFPQVHEPGVDAQSDFTHMASLGVTLGGVPFPHLAFPLVVVYSNVEAVRVCFSESFEALGEGLESCLWPLGGVPRRHRTDHLSAAIRPLDAEGRAQASERSGALLHLAASTSEAEVEVALGLLLDQGALPSFDAVRDLGRIPVAPHLPVRGPAVLDLGRYDRLLGASHG